jgi:hypothetical protein
MELTRKFIDQLAAGETSAAKETIESDLSSRSFNALDAYKKQIAASVFGGQPQQETVESEVEVQETE